MKNEVVAALADKELKGAQRFNRLLKLYRKHRYANPMLSRNYNRSGYSKNNLKTLEYDVKQLYEVSAGDLKKVLNQVQDDKVKDLETSAEQEGKEVPDQARDDKAKGQVAEDIEKVNLKEADYYKEILPLATKWAASKGEDLKSRKKADLIAYLEAAKEELFKKK